MCRFFVSAQPPARGDTSGKHQYSLGWGCRPYANPSTGAAAGVAVTSGGWIGAAWQNVEFQKSSYIRPYILTKRKSALPV